MCLCPSTYPTNSKYIDLSQIGQRLTNTFNCGKCSQCLSVRELEYYLRSSAEYNDTIARGGFVYWDTLTYSPEYLPVLRYVYRYHWSDELLHWYQVKEFDLYRGEQFMNDEGTTLRTFNRDDIRLFFRNLRQILKRKGYDHKGNLRYFLVSEYGDPKNHTFRPHYHIILFCCVPNLTPQQLQDLVRYAWKYGRCDLETPLYPVRDLKTGKLKGRLINSIAVTGYVAKYVNKPFKFHHLLTQFRDRNGLTKDLFNLIRPFHRQSKGFGLTLMDNFTHGDVLLDNHDLMVREGKIHFVDFGEHRTYPMPSYLKRKLFYDCVKYADGTRHWVLNELGYVYKSRNEKILINKQIQRLEDTIRNINSLNVLQNDYLRKTILERKELSRLHSHVLPYTDYSKLIRDLLGNRTLHDLVIYSRYYQGRSVTFEPLKYNYQKCIAYDLLTVKPDFSDPDQRWSQFHSAVGGVYEYDENTCLYNSIDFYDSILGELWLKRSRVPRYEIIRQHAIDESTYKCFENFDTIMMLINIFNFYSSTSKFKQFSDKQDSEISVTKIRSHYAHK